MTNYKLITNTYKAPGIVTIFIVNKGRGESKRMAWNRPGSIPKDPENMQRVFSPGLFEA